MDIAALSIVLKQMQLSQQVGVSVLKLAMDSAKTQTAGITKIMEQAVNPNLGANIDITV
jgi:hypothetical protein